MVCESDWLPLVTVTKRHFPPYSMVPFSSHLVLTRPIKPAAHVGYTDKNDQQQQTNSDTVKKMIRLTHSHAPPGSGGGLSWPHYAKP